MHLLALQQQGLVSITYPLLALVAYSSRVGLATAVADCDNRVGLNPSKKSLAFTINLSKLMTLYALCPLFTNLQF